MHCYCQGKKVKLRVTYDGVSLGGRCLCENKAAHMYSLGLYGFFVCKSCNEDPKLLIKSDNEGWKRVGRYIKRKAKEKVNAQTV